MKIGIFIHLFIVNMFDEFKDYINNVKNEFKDVTIIFTLQDASWGNDMGKIIKLFFHDCHIIYIENKGVDVYSFFEQIKYCRKNNLNFDYILKIHTKESNFNNLTCWRKDLIEPITNSDNLKLIHKLMYKENIGYFASKKLIFPKCWEKTYVNNIINQINNLTTKFPYLPKNYIDFIGGTMFWINYKIIDNYLTPEVIDYLSNYLTVGKITPSHNDKFYAEYLFERLITGPLCYKSINVLIDTDYLNLANPYRYVNIGDYLPNIITFHKPMDIDNLYYSEYCKDEA